MKHELVEKRDRLIIEAWENHRDEYTMADIADCFGMYLGSVYRIIAEVKKKQGRQIVRETVEKVNRERKQALIKKLRE